ncbi:MAG: hypothetical protein QNJ98_09575 [Planctomycetota bacterium]|nr:hypothetical protein [Planctomycetota bacterium]
MRTLALASAVVILLVLPAAAEEGGTILRPEDLELVPMEHTSFGLLRFEHRRLVHTLEHRHDVLREFDGERDEAGGKPGAWRQAEREVAAKALAEASRKLEAVLRARGIDDRTLIDIATFPDGPMRVERYAFAAVRTLPMGEQEGPLVREVAAATLGALLALDVRIRALDEAEEAHEEDEERPEAAPDEAANPEAEARARQRDALEEQGERIRRRFWQMLDYVLDDGRKRNLVNQLPHPLRETEDVFDHAMHLPALKIGQMARIRALEAELYSEAGPDHALAERLERKVHDPALTDEQREALWMELDTTWNRVVEREHATKQRLLRVLTDAQRQFLAAIPPRVSVDQRLAEPEVVLAGVALTPAQTAKLVPLAKDLLALREQLDTQMEALRTEMADMGPDSPQMAGMEMREASVAGSLIRKTHDAMRTIFVDVMRPDQVIQWVITRPAGDD